MTKNLPKLFLIGLVIVLGGLAVGCVESNPIVPVPPTPTVADPISPKRPDFAPTPTPATRNFPLPAATLLPIAARPSSQNCVDCHTDVEMLKAVAKEPEVVESLSEGEG